MILVSKVLTATEAAFNAIPGIRKKELKIQFVSNLLTYLAAFILVVFRTSSS